MNVTVTKLEGSRVEVEGTLPADTFEEYIKEATRAFVAETELPGFRKGKVPEKMVLEHVGETRILQHAAEEALRDIWPDILEEKNIEAIGPASFHLLKLARGNELVWKAEVATLPNIVLPDYKVIAKEKNEKREQPNLEITDKEIDETIQYIQRVRTKEGEATPPIDDAFAKSVGNFESLDALKQSIRDGIKTEKEAKAREAHRMSIIDGIADRASIEIPAVMIEGEKDKMLRELQSSIEDMGLQWNEYLAHLKKSEAELRKEWDADATRRVKTGLSLREISRVENISPNEEDVGAQIEKMLAPYSEAERGQLDHERIHAYATGIVRNEKVFQFLESC